MFLLFLRVNLSVFVSQFSPDLPDDSTSDIVSSEDDLSELKQFNHNKIPVSRLSEAHGPFSKTALKSQMNIFIIPLCGRVFSVTVESNDTVQNVKHKVQRKTGLVDQLFCKNFFVIGTRIPTNLQILFHAGTLLEDGKGLQSYNIERRNTALHLVVASPQGTVKFFHKKYFPWIHKQTER